MAVRSCSFCNQPMEPGRGCTLPEYDDLPAGPWKRVPSETKECRDCHVSRGQLHHPGCDQEKCPACGGIAVSCDCAAEGDEEEQEEREDPADVDKALEEVAAKPAEPEGHADEAPQEQTEPEPVDPVSGSDDS